MILSANMVCSYGINGTLANGHNLEPQATLKTLLYVINRKLIDQDTLCHQPAITE